MTTHVKMSDGIGDVFAAWPPLALTTVLALTECVCRLAAPLLRLSWLRRLGRWFISPLVAWIVMNAIFIGWHVPAAYDFALRHELWHDFEHSCFLAG